MTHNEPRVYGGDCNLVHIADGTRKEMGVLVAAFLENRMRRLAGSQNKNSTGPLCPGCVMIALFNAAVILADENGQSREELGRTMAQAFTKLAENPNSGLTEEIEVVLDKD